jgi:hypothetical protein
MRNVADTKRRYQLVSLHCCIDFPPPSADKCHKEMVPRADIAEHVLQNAKVRQWVAAI